MGFNFLQNLHQHYYDLSIRYQFKIQMQLPVEKAGCVIGKGGCNIKTLISMTNCFMMIPNHPVDNNPMLRMLTIAANDQATLDRGHQEVLNVIANNGVLMTSPSSGNYIVMKLVSSILQTIYCSFSLSLFLSYIQIKHISIKNKSINVK